MKYTAVIVVLFVFFEGAVSQDFGRRERTYDVQHYRIELSFDHPKKTVFGNVTTTLKALRPSFKEIIFDAVNMTIESVTQGNGAPLRFSYDSTHLTIHFDRPYAYGEELTTTVRYHCTPQKGMYFIGPNASYPDDPEQIWTQGQGEDNRHWLPSYDYPNDRATSEVIMTARSGFETLSNGSLKSKSDNGDGTTTWHWVMDKPHSSYLIMIAVGKYAIYEDEYDGIPIHSYHYESDHRADVERTYRTTAEMTKFFSKKIGINYPWSKYAQISVRHFMYGGMENTTATVMNDKRMVVDARAALDYSPDGLIAHELAHQWWGDYLTYVDWENGWLNEGFATYFQQVWTQYKYGEDDFTTQRNGGIMGYIEWADRVGRLPVVSKKGNVGQNIYPKGAAVLHMLRTLLGEEQFWRVINAYGRKFALQSVETNDLKRTIEEVTGMNLQWFFEQWLYKAGYPELHVSKKWDAVSKTLSLAMKQVQKTDSVCGIFRLPMDVRFYFSPKEFTDERIWMNAADTSYTFTLEKEPQFVSVDHGSVLCGRITVEQTRDELIAHLQHNHDVRKRVLAAEALLQRTEDALARKALMHAAKSDPHYSVRLRIASGFADLKADSVSFKKEHKAVLVDLTKDAMSVIRTTAVNGLNKLKDRSLKPLFEKTLRDSSSMVEAAAMNAILKIDSTTTQALVKKRLHSESFSDVLARDALEWVKTYRMKALTDDVLKLARPGAPYEVRAKAWEALSVLDVPQEKLLPMLAAQLQEPVARFRALAAKYVTVVAAPQAQSILTRHLEMESDNVVKQSIRRLLGQP